MKFATAAKLAATVPKLVEIADAYPSQDTLDGPWFVEIALVHGCYVAAFNKRDLDKLVRKYTSPNADRWTGR